MSLFAGDPRLAPYADSSNLARVEAVQRRSAPRIRVRPCFDEGVTVIILNLDRPELLLPLCRKLQFDHDYHLASGHGFEVLIGDTGSTHPEVLAFYREAPEWIRVVRGLTYHFSCCNNALFFEHARYARTLFLNNDIVAELESRCLVAMADHLLVAAQTGVVGHTLWFADGRVQHAGVDFFRAGHPLSGLCYHPGANQPDGPETWRKQWPVPAVTGACLMVRSDLFARLGGFDEAYTAECQDVDLCLAVGRLGYQVEILNTGRLLHLENATRVRGEEQWADRRLLVRRWAAYLASQDA